jgi:hypothetical protein
MTTTLTADNPSTAQAISTASRLGGSTLDDEAVLQRGREAFERITSNATWTDWLAVGEALRRLRTAAMREAFTNEPVGRAYNEAFGQRLHQHGFDKLDKGDRSRLFDCMEHRDEIEAWRSTLTLNQRLQWNHPTTVLRHWKAAHDVPKGEKKPSPFAETKQALAEQIEENHRLKREIDRGGGDLWTTDDRPDDIAKVMAIKLSTDKLERTARAMLAIARQRRAARKTETPDLGREATP